MGTSPWPRNQAGYTGDEGRSYHEADLNASFGSEYCRSNIEVSFGTHDLGDDGKRHQKKQIPEDRHEAAEFVFFAKPIRPLIAFNRDANNAIPGVQNRSAAVAAKNDRIDHEVRNLVVNLAQRDRAMVNVDAVALVVSRKTEQRNRLANLRIILGADPEFHTGRHANRELRDIAHFVVLDDCDRVAPIIVAWPRRIHHRALPGNVLDRVEPLRIPLEDLAGRPYVLLGWQSIWSAVNLLVTGAALPVETISRG
jgi:hypothetical protein